MEQALEALNLINHRGNNDEELFKVGQTVTLIQERLAEDDEEPVYTGVGDDGELIHWYRRPASAPKKLTDEEIAELWGEPNSGNTLMLRNFARAIERRINGEEG